MPNREKVLITVALLYANGQLHFGHIAGAYLPGDVYARAQRLQGKDVLFLSGSDEYGVAITLNAELAGRTPQAHVDHYHALNSELFRRLGIEFDHYARTTWPKHHELVDQIFHDLLANGYVEPQESEQLYCDLRQRFLADRYVTGTCPKCGYSEARGDECPKCGTSYEATDLGSPRSRISGAPLTHRKTINWVLRLDKFKDKLEAWVAERNWRPNVKNFVKSYLDDLRPRQITRDASWGIPVPLPEAEGKIFYVWFEACIGYLSAAREWAQAQGDPDLWKSYWCDPKTRLVHFIGKDNIFFHSLFFPATLMGQNQPYVLCEDLPANEFLNLEGRQFSKSDNWTIDLTEFLDAYSADQIRYTLAANAPETGDSEFTWDDFQIRCNSELLGKYGNFANRTLVFAHKQCDGKIPSPQVMSEIDQQFLADLKTTVQEILQSYNEYKLRQACQLIMKLAHLGNTYFDHSAPWKSAKSPETRPQMETTIANCFECLKLMALASYPVIPATAEKVWELIGQAPEGSIAFANWDAVVSNPLRPGQSLPQPEILFNKIENEQIELEKNKLGKQ